MPTHEPPWIVYYHDYSDFVIFRHEVDALRYAVANGMQCEQVAYGAPKGGTGEY